MEMLHLESLPACQGMVVAIHVIILGDACSELDQSLSREAGASDRM